MLIGYARVSTGDQNHDLQIDAITAAGCEVIHKDIASGGARTRAGLVAALSAMQEGDTLVVWRLDRLARSLRQLIETVEDLEARGIKFRSLTEDIDTSSAGGRLVFQIFGALAEFEREIIRERTCAGLAAARSRGRTGGRPRRLSELDIQTAKTALKEKQWSIAETASYLGVSKATLYRSFARNK